MYVCFARWFVADLVTAGWCFRIATGADVIFWTCGIFQALQRSRTAEPKIAELCSPGTNG